MSAPDLVLGTFVAVKIESPIDSGTFVNLCGMATRTFVEQVNTRDRFVRDCDDPLSIPFRHVIATGKQWNLSASGVYNRNQAELISAAVGAIRKYQFYIGEPADDAIYESYFQGNAMLTQRQIGGNDGDDVTSELTFASDGEWTETEV